MLATSHEPSVAAPRAAHSTPADADKVAAYRELIADVQELAAVSRRVSEPEAAAVGITGAQWHTLSVLEAGPATVPAVAERLGVTRQAIQRVVDDLVVQHLVERRPNPRHARSPLHRITPEGRRRLERLDRQSVTPRARAMAAVSTEQLSAARAVLRAVIDGLRPVSTR